MYSRRATRWFPLAWFVLFLVGAEPCIPSKQGTLRAQEKVPDLSSLTISKAQLNPPLRMELKELRFSPNGEYILVQDDSTIYVLDRSPLAVRFSLEAHDALPARFSAESNLLWIPTRRGVEARSLPENEIKFQSGFGLTEDCKRAALSPNGEFYACVDEKLRLRAFQVSTQKQVLDFQIQCLACILPAEPPRVPDWVLNLRSGRTEPILQFSPDSRYLLSGTGWINGIAVDLRSGKQIQLAGKVRDGLGTHTLIFLTPETVAYADPHDFKRLTILKFPSGREVRRGDWSGGPAAAGNANYLLEYSLGSSQIRIMDVRTLTMKTALLAERADVSTKGEIAAYQQNGKLMVSDISGKKAAVEMTLPAGLLSALQTAVVSPGLQWIALSGPNEGGIYDISTGARAANLEGFRGAWFENDRTCYVQIPLAGGSSLHVWDLKAGSERVISTWKRKYLSVRYPFRGGDISLLQDEFSGPVLLRSLLEPAQSYAESLQYPYRFHIDARDATNGEHLWTRFNAYVVSAPFSDPQGDRVVLGSFAKEAKYESTVKKTIKEKKRQEGKVQLFPQDSYLEVLDAKTGKSLGGFLDQRGNGPFQIVTAFSTGDWVVLLRDRTHYDICSLRTGKPALRTFGNYVAVSGERNSMALAREGSHVILYDLTSGSQSRDLNFPSNVVYLHFSTHGQRLMVLTENQMMYVLDTSNIGHAPATTPKAD